MKKPLCILTFLVLASTLRGQQTARLFGDITSPDGEPLELVNITLNSATDSTIINFAISDEKGHFEFNDLPEVTCFLVASYIGYAEFSSDTFTVHATEQFRVPTIQFSLQTNELSGVEVTAARKMFEVKADKIVFNVANTINAAAGNALELLRKSPGVVVTNSDNITLLGQSGVEIYLDGKPSPLKGSDLATHLRTLSASEIESIEIITNPSSKYDAEGSAGIINIRLKKNKNYGLNTYLHLGYSTGEKAWYYGYLSSNYRNKTINLFGEYSLNIGENISTRQLIREQQGMVFDQSNTSTTEWINNKFKAGMDIYLSEKATLGFRVDGNYNNFLWIDAARTPIYEIGQERFDSVLISQYKVDGIRKNLQYNINYRYVDSKGASLVFDADYSSYFNPNKGEQPNTVLDSTGKKILNQTNFYFENPTRIDLLSFKGDYEKNFLSGRLGLGVKTTFTNTDNRFDFYKTLATDNILDTDRSNQFVYTEKVIAGYLNYAREFKKVSFQVGLRGEKTFSIGELTSTKQTKDDNTKREYFDLFPSAGFTYSPNSKNSLQINYSRRINRPSYQDLNPFVIQKDEFNYEQGNPFLTPEYTDKFQITHSFNHQLYTSVGYSHTKDLIVRIRDTIEGSSTIRQWLNLGYKKYYNLNIGFSHQFAKWWSTYNSLTAYYMENFGTYGANKVIDVNAKAINFYGQHSFRLPKSFSMEISGWFNSPTIWGANMESKAIWSIDFGIQKKLWNSRGRLQINVSDIFRSSGWYGVSRFEGLTTTSSGYSDSRRLSVYFSYLFGNERVKSKKHKTGLEEEKNRLESDQSDKG